MAAPITVLDPELHVPWVERFKLCCGVEALTGDSKNPALRRSIMRNQSPNQVPKLTTFVRIIHEVHEQSRRHPKVQGTINIDSMSPSALDLPFAIGTSHLAFEDSFLVETILSGEYDFEQLDLGDLELTSEAQSIVSNSTPEEFSEMYGDYFVCGSQRRFWFHALVECR